MLLLFFLPILSLAQAPLSLLVPITHKCGNVEFAINFMKPKIMLLDSKQLANFTLTDTMDEANPMHVELNGKAHHDPLIVDTFYRPLCTKKMLLEICTVDESVDVIQVYIEFEPNICYVDKDKYVESAEIVM